MLADEIASVRHSILKSRLSRRTLLMVIGIGAVIAVILGVGFWGVVLPRLASGAYLGPSFNGYSVIYQIAYWPWRCHLLWRAVHQHV